MSIDRLRGRRQSHQPSSARRLDIGLDDKQCVVLRRPLCVPPLQIPRSPRAEFQECYAVFVQAPGFARHRRNALLSASSCLDAGSKPMMAMRQMLKWFGTMLSWLLGLLLVLVNFNLNDPYLIVLRGW